MSTVTLLDVQKYKKDAYDKGLLDVFMRECNISAIVPIVTTGTMEVSARLRNSIPTLNWRQRGQAYGSVQAPSYQTVTDQVFALGGNIDIDKVDMRDKNLLEDPLTVRSKDFAKAAAWTLNDIIINGDHATNADAPEGLKVRIATLSSDQTIYANTSSASLDVRPSASPTNDTLYKWFDKIDEAKYACDGHQADVVFTNAATIRALKSGLRRMGISKLNKELMEPAVNPSGKRSDGSEAYQKAIFEYDGLKFYDVGLNAAQTSGIIGSETIGDATYPMYFVRFGEDYFHLIQEYAMEISKPRMLEDGVTWRTGVDWPVGTRHVHPRFGAVLKGSRVS